MRFAIAAVLAIATVSPARSARANGDNTHIWITQHAVEHLPEGRLKTMLQRSDLQAALINGSVFPDGGYVIKDDFGEMAHWEPFVQAYVEWMREDVAHPYDYGDAAKYAAFLFGVASHDIADQVFDSSFVENARILDAAGWSDDLLTGHDTATDVMLVSATHVAYADTPRWIPTAELAALYHDRLSYDIDPFSLDSAQSLLFKTAVTYASSTNATTVAELEARYPWTAEHLMGEHELGAPPCEAEVVAAYWLALWDRLHDESGEQNFLVATYPRDGATSFATDHTSPYAQLVLVFGSGVQRTQLTDRFEVVDSNGKSYALTVDTQWGSANANVVKIRALEDWAPNATFHVTVKPGLDFIDGDRMESPFTFSFSTAPGDPGAPFGDPTPHEGEPDVGAVPAAGCCSSSGASSDAAGAMLLAGVLCFRKRRRVRPYALL